MTDPTSVRDLYRRHESVMDGAGERLMPAVHALRRRNRNRRLAGLAVTAAAVIGVVALVALAWIPRDTAAVYPTDHQVTPTGYRLVSSLGAQVAVPADWLTNDIDTCRSDNRPTVVRPIGDAASAGCGQVTAQKEFAWISTSHVVVSEFFFPRPSTLPTAHPAVVDGVPATAAEGRIADGMYVGWLIVASHDVSIVVHVRSRATLNAILGSFHLVAYDNVGCPTKPPAQRPTARGGAAFVDPRPMSISVCFYERIDTAVLIASRQRSGSDARSLATALNATARGVNPRPADTDLCTATSNPPNYDVLLLIRSADGTAHAVTVRLSGCTGNGLDNGRQLRQIPATLAAAIQAGANVYYPFAG